MITSTKLSTDKLTLFNLGELHLLEPGDLVSYKDAPGAESVCCLDLESSGCSVSSFRRGKSGRESSPPICPSAIANLTCLVKIDVKPLLLW